MAASWIYWRLLSLTIVLCAGLIIFEFAAPIYSGVHIRNVEIVDDGYRATLSFIKERNCKPVRNSGVAFAHYGLEGRRPVDVLAQHGRPVQLANFPVMTSPITLTYTWKLPDYAKYPTALSYNFAVTCITGLRQHQSWMVSIDEPPLPNPELN